MECLVAGQTIVNLTYCHERLGLGLIFKAPPPIHALRLHSAKVVDHLARKHDLEPNLPRANPNKKNLYGETTRMRTGNPPKNQQPKAMTNPWVAIFHGFMDTQHDSRTSRGRLGFCDLHYRVLPALSLHCPYLSGDSTPNAHLRRLTKQIFLASLCWCGKCPLLFHRKC